jgi:hypothetical protein
MVLRTRDCNSQRPSAEPWDSGRISCPDSLSLSRRHHVTALADRERGVARHGCKLAWWWLPVDASAPGELRFHIPHSVCLAAFWNVAETATTLVALWILAAAHAVEAVSAMAAGPHAHDRRLAAFAAIFETGDPGIEPGVAVLETTVLPIHQSPGGPAHCRSRGRLTRSGGLECGRRDSNPQAASTRPPAPKAGVSTISPRPQLHRSDRRDCRVRGRWRRAT